MVLYKAIDIDDMPIDDLVSVLCVKPYGVIQHIIEALQRELRARDDETWWW